jgi:hypothetical protein
VTLSDPQLVDLDVLDLPVFPLVPGPNRLPGYELSTHVGARISFQPRSQGGRDLSFALDGQTEHRHKSTISVKFIDPG